MWWVLQNQVSKVICIIWSSSEVRNWCNDRFVSVAITLCNLPVVDPSLSPICCPRTVQCTYCSRNDGESTPYICHLEVYPRRAGGPCSVDCQQWLKLQCQNLFWLTVDTFRTKNGNRNVVKLYWQAAYNDTSHSHAWLQRTRIPPQRQTSWQVIAINDLLANWARSIA